MALAVEEGDMARHRMEEAWALKRKLVENVVDLASCFE